MAANQTPTYRESIQIALAGMLALSIAMGIGRFSFTPILPMMQSDGTLTLTLGGWLASSNYLGYLIGGLTARLLMSQPVLLVKAALFIIVATTIWMGIADDYSVWLTLRLVSGAAGAWVMVGVSVLCMPRLTQTPRIASLVFTGVGCGITLTGLVCLGLFVLGMTADAAWIVTGLLAMLLGLAIWPVFSEKKFGPTTRGMTYPAARMTQQRPLTSPTPQRHILIWCYGISGFGYIIPATFLPAQARVILGDTPLFGLAWPVFGIASAAMVFFAGLLCARWGRIRIWMIAHLVMALGGAIPTFWPGLTGIIVAALCVGGTFAAVSLIAIQHAQAVSGAEAPSMVARLTTAYATGQILGPIFISLLRGNISLALWTGASALILSAWLLSRLPQDAPR
jgi:predicted MFS family arabinose efflux permease